MSSRPAPSPAFLAGRIFLPFALGYYLSYLLRTVNAVISPDLTRNDKEKQKWSGGPITGDNTGVEVYGTIFSIAESRAQRGVIWVGSDDGLPSAGCSSPPARACPRWPAAAA